jgi:hypothetical protein
VCDTPPTSDASYGCQTNRESCNTGTLAMIKNYMDYSDGNCMDMFTVGQKSRSDASMNSFRSLIYSTANIKASGLNADGTYVPLSSSSLKAPYKCGFNMGDFSRDGWRFENYTSPGDSGWKESTKAAYEGSGAMCARNVLHVRLNNRNAFVSPSIDLTNLSNPRLSFLLAYAKRIGASNDRIKVFISNNFGRTEELLTTLTPADMATGLTSSTEFVPSVDEWKSFKIDLSAYKEYNNCQIRFELTSLRGNNIYIDNFDLGDATGVGKSFENQFDFNLFPNPVNDNLSISFKQPVIAHFELSIYSIDGALILTKAYPFASESEQIDFNIEALHSGVYLFEIKSDKGNLIKRFIKN